MSAPPGYYPPPPPSRPIGVAILAILLVLVGVLVFLGALAVLFISTISLPVIPTFGLVGDVVGIIGLVIALIIIGVGLGLWHLRSWAWWLAVIVMVLFIIGSFSSPLSAVLPLLLLIYLILVRHHFR